MLIKPFFISVVLCVVSGFKENNDWEIAVVIDDQIELLQSNGTLIEATVEQFSRLKALTFDNVRHQFIVSDENHNDTIFSVQITKETEITPIIPDLPDNVLGLAVDPIDYVLFWTDLQNKSITFANLNESDFEPHLLFQFDHATPQDIAVDVCGRYLYWTNCQNYHATIERSFLNGTNREIIIQNDLVQPTGITIDYRSRKIYWADLREGIYYRIESANMNGDDRRIVYEGTHTKPFGIAVDETSIYWTDVSNNALWRYFKSGKSREAEKIREFKEKPMGIIAKNVQIGSYPDCKDLEVVMETYGDDVKESFVRAALEESADCFNGGTLIGNTCSCTRGFSGRNCEIDSCSNFCVRGICKVSQTGVPECNCPNGFGGVRCENDMCRSYCLNEGTCSYSKGNILPRCECPQYFSGSRCEVSVDFNNLCRLYCLESTSKNDYLLSKDRKMICRCEPDDFVVSKNNLTAFPLYSENSPFYGRSFLEKFSEDSDYTILVLALSLCILLIVGLTVYHFATRQKRPIIRKRVIVNKNLTPLTDRPQRTEQCEITIENCCNMNVCETPCFEPPSFKEDRRVLLSDMETEEMY